MKTKYTRERTTSLSLKGKTLLLFTLLVIQACAPSGISVIETEGTDDDADKLLVVDCLLPGQIKRLGTGMTYVTPRRPAKLTANECEKRGGEYVAYDQANSATALKVWLPAAQEGDKVAQVYVGEIYEKGFGIEPDYATAAKWYVKAAAQGDARAKLNLGFLYEKGLGVPMDVSKALQLYRDASGLQDTTIAYEAALDVTKSGGLSDEELRRLKNDLATNDETVKNLKKGIEMTRSRVSSQTEQIAQLSTELDKSRKALEQSKQAPEQASTQVAQLEQQLTSREQELEKRRQEIARLEAELNQSTVALKDEEEKSTIDIAEPQISIVKPLLVSVRGLQSLQVSPEIKTKEIIGRVYAPAGVTSLTINNKAETLNDSGLFKTLLPISERSTDVTVNVVDKLGRQANLTFSITQDKVDVSQKIAIEDIDASKVKDEFNNFYALVIGNDVYRSFDKLSTAVNDAKSVSDLLTNRYGFKTTTLINANRFTILATLNRLSKRLTEKDNLIIYYAGHGELDENKIKGYWLPVDADKSNKKRWISNAAITDLISEIKAKRTLIIADSCYAGTLTSTSLPTVKSAISKTDRLAWMRAVAKSKARTALTSGGISPVADAGPDGHSVFAKSLIEVLTQNSRIMEGRRLYQEVSNRLATMPEAVALGQVPSYAPIQHAGHQSGEFFLFPRNI